MKQIKKLIQITLIPLSLLYSCNGNGNADVSKDSTTSSTSSTKNSDANSTGDASFSATLDGVKISGGKIDDMQLQNTAFIYPTADNNGKKLLFYLYSDKTGNDSYSLMFAIPDKTGSFTKNLHDEQPFDITLDFLGGDLSRYIAQAVTIDITSITASRVTGTFSGKLALSPDTPNGTKKEIAVTDGKFDIPFSTGNMRPQ